MTEQDLFEQRLRAALRRHTADSPVRFDALDFAHTAAARAPRRHGLARVVAWRLAPAPMPAWVLLTVLLLTALVAGLLVVGSRPQEKLPAVVPPVGQLFTCPPGSTPDKPGPVGQARPTDPWTMAFDRRAGRLVAVAGPVETWAFDVCSNTWTRMYPDWIRMDPDRDAAVSPREGFGQLVYDVDSDLTIASDRGRMWAYDLEANTWTQKNTFAPSATGLRFYDPVSGHVVALGDDGDDDTLSLKLSSYDVETDTWTPIPQSNRLTIGPHYEFFTYDASADRLIAYSNA